MGEFPNQSTQFQPGNPGGPGRTPTKIPSFLRRLTECEDDAERERLITIGMKNPLIAAKLRAIAADDLELANKASEQVLDRVFGRATQRQEIEASVDLRALMIGELGGSLSE